jgi:sorbitol-6-phosphate 2-dehydrogenase
MANIKGKVTLVFGASQGLGEALAMRFGIEGCPVAVCDINYEGVKKTADEVKKKAKVETAAFKVDVTNENEVKAAVEETVKKFGRIDIMISNAGILIAEDITDFPADKWKKVIDVNLSGYFICAKETAKVMKKQKSGSIIQINSKSGKKGSFRNSAYAASKFGGIGLTQSIALDLAPFNVRVNSICPGNLLDSPLWVNSLFDQYSKRLGISKEAVRQKYIDQVPLKRGCTYDDVSNVAVFLAGDDASYMTGQAINVTGGQEMN